MSNDVTMKSDCTYESYNTLKAGRSYRTDRMSNLVM
jgi:hypothetical protein